ncbi:hypothetical protein ECDEC14C_2751 [Escherichia coli DEC14C]|nr:hypothetical protein ECDEC14C_2751 [Escherichia coli DEC14C]EIQ70340.1 hypothetical protein ECEPECC34262_2885 [Escherichia coli EPEC C342-62]END68889.1 hypothetical protein ECP02994831_2673 [Escherichia coli P0299483.1]END79538.1 hypothetical protein ECP02994832_2694 [Escherichia coli P0299483.2]END82613.1 hypothetical protein ECP02994833_2464 [Escherichia coli P0299483.3]KEJ75044.1 hypothetical protein AB67_2606 [Escherichia coli 5-366-08_S1_C3]
MGLAISLLLIHFSCLYPMSQITNAMSTAPMVIGKRPLA